MKIEQFVDKALAHFSYAILSENKIALIDPSRNPEVYLNYARKNNAEIVAIIETHTHADFVSSHMEFNQMGVKVYASKITNAQFYYINFDDGDILKLGKVLLKALNTPGHSLDSISIILEDEGGNKHAVFTGDTLFLGDVGRPDLREHTGESQQLKENLASLLYDSLRTKLMKLPDSTLVYPTHGAGSFCGKSMSTDLYGTIGEQKKENYALQDISKNEFIKIITQHQPAIPKYFPYDVELNRQGPPLLKNTLNSIPEVTISKVKSEIVIDTRPSALYIKGHFKNSINIPNGLKFETWVGSIIGPNEKFYIVIDKNERDEILNKISKIGYELNTIGILNSNEDFIIKDEIISNEEFNRSINDYTILDVREKSETDASIFFKNSINIPLGNLRENISKLPSNKPIAIHCAGGYRSSIGSSILKLYTNNKVYDIGEAIKNYKPIIE